MAEVLGRGGRQVTSAEKEEGFRKTIVNNLTS